MCKARQLKAGDVVAHEGVHREVRGTSKMYTEGRPHIVLTLALAGSYEGQKLHCHPDLDFHVISYSV